MRRRGVECLVRSVILVLCALLCYHNLSHAQDEGVEPGHSIGKVSTDGNLIVMQLEDSALGKANLFDLVGQTLRFTPDGSQYRVDHRPLNWDSDFGSQLAGAEVTFHQFAFPFLRQEVELILRRSDRIHKLWHAGKRRQPRRFSAPRRRRFHRPIRTAG